MEEDTKPMSLLELLSRTRLQVFTYEQGTMAKMAYPNGAGSGFFLRHKDRMINFGIHADRVHLKWDTTIHENMKYVGETGD